MRPVQKFTRNYRDSMVITAQVLNAVRAGANKTAIMYRARLSFEQLQRYLKKLNETGLLHYNTETRLYTATQKGLLYLGNYTEMQGIVEELDAKKAIVLKLLSHDEVQEKKSHPQDPASLVFSRLTK